MDAILDFVHITIFLSVIFCIFGVFCWCLLFLWFCLLLMFVFAVIKIVKLEFFAIKHRDNLRCRKQDGSRVNTFLLSGFMSSFCLVMFRE